MKYVENVMEAIKDGITVANLRRSDIQKVSTYDYTQYKHEPSEWEESTGSTTGDLIQFGQSKTYSDTPKYPTMWGEYDSKWTYEYNGTTETGSDKECEMWERENGDGKMTGKGTGITNPTFKQSFYAHDYRNQQKQFINEEYYNLLFKDKDGNWNGDCWLAGRCVILYTSGCDFDLQFVRGISNFCGTSGFRLMDSWRDGVFGQS